MLFVLTVVFWCDDMEKRQEQRSVIKFMQKSGATPNQCWARLHAVYGAETFSKTAVRKWFKEFSEGRESTKDQPRSGRPRSARTPGNIQWVLTAVQTERSSTIGELSTHLQLSQTAVRTILKKDLCMSKLCPKFVPKVLTAEQKAFRVRLCLENIQRLKDDSDLLRKIVTGDESWVSVQEVALKKDSKEWHPRGSQRPLKAIRNRSARKSMVTIFFDWQGPVLTEFTPPGETVNAEAYCTTLQRLPLAVQ